MKHLIIQKQTPEVEYLPEVLLVPMLCCDWFLSLNNVIQYTGLYHIGVLLKIYLDLLLLSVKYSFICSIK